MIATLLPLLLTTTGLSAFIFALLGLAYLVVWWRDREQGLAGLGLSVLLLGAFYLADAIGINRPNPQGFGPPPGFQLLLEGLVMLMAVSLARYLGERPSWRRPLLPLLLLPNLVLVLLSLGHQPLGRLWSNLALTFVFVGLAIMAWRARRREPGAGHGVIAVSLLLLPSASVMIALKGADPAELRPLAVLPVVAFYLMLLPVSLRRHHRALEAEVLRRREAESHLSEFNATLEARIAERTADLRNMVTGLEGFNRSVSHDLSGPLGGIEGMASLAKDVLAEGDATAVLGMLDAIEKQAHTSRELVASLLELARVGEAQLRLAPVSLDALARDVIDDLLLRRTTPRPEVSLQSLPTVVTDASLLRPVLMNLIGNAFKFSQQRPAPRVDIAAHRADGDWVIEVRDNGTGFDDAAAQQLFEPFLRLHDNRYAGHGVGLSIVRRAVERLGGRVWAQGQPGEGACFSFTLPNRDADPS